MIGIIGSNGLVGSYLKEVVNYTHEFNSDNINDIGNYAFNTMYIAAPSGNRITANTDPEKDLASTQLLIENLRRTSIDTVILIGTVDSVLRNHLPYGRHRLWLEEQIMYYFENSYVLRLGALIHKNIKKNVLYDLKHNMYLDKINLNISMQWYDLTNLKNDIDYSIKHNIQTRNLISENISNREIVEKFFPLLSLNSAHNARISLAPCAYTKQDIFKSMKNYLHG
jgi:hypothetical protein